MWWKKDYFWKPVREALGWGFVEKQLELRSGLTVNYAESPTKGIPLLLVPGQLLPVSEVVEIRGPHDLHFARAASWGSWRGSRRACSRCGCSPNRGSAASCKLGN